MSGFMETLTTLSQKLTKGEEYEALVKELATSRPLVQYQDLCCNFCGESEESDHKPDCIWLRAKALVEE